MSALLTKEQVLTLEETTPALPNDELELLWFEALVEDDYRTAWDEALADDQDRTAISASEFENAFGLREEEFDVAAAVESLQPPQFDVVAWEMRLKELAKSNTEVRWELGDWLLKGENNYPVPPDGEFPGVGFYIVAAEITGLAANTLRDLASTARRVPASVRTDACTWSHHRVLVNALPDADEHTLRKWLTRASEEKMSVPKLREAVRPRKPKPYGEKSFVVTVPLGVWETLKDFADFERSKVQEIATQWLVETSEQPEIQSGRSVAKKQTAERLYQKRRRNGLRSMAVTCDLLGLNR